MLVIISLRVKNKRKKNYEISVPAPNCKPRDYLPQINAAYVTKSQNIRVAIIIRVTDYAIVSRVKK